VFLTVYKKADIVISKSYCFLKGTGVEGVMNTKIKDDMTDKLFEAILLLENIEECYNFFEDICTVAEIKALAQRLEVAKMLRDGRTYTDIVERTGASTATISRINRALNYGADGYKTILDKLSGNT
jgi:TrpR-related protein YerC/YecD